MPERRQSTPPSAFPAEAELSHPLYSFRCDQWFDHPTPNGPDWFSAEERARRDANAYAYRQHGTKENWFRYLYLGFFVFEDCFECDKLWAAMESDPLQVHRSIWYNFRFHVDQEMDIPPQLNAWAMNVSREYLSHYDPSTLHDTDTLAYSWKTMPFMTTPMDTDDQTDWIPVMGRRRSKSPPKSTDNEPPPTNNTTTVSPDRLLESLEDESPSSLALSAFKVQRNRIHQKKRFSKLSWSQGLPPVTTVTEDIEEERS
ncbi:hypothetical protein MHU86_19341 [Fragilaria crotonensis]|nr:hypothetical protein MHU86_19341 [Fragilaria crotonensis]